MKKTRTRRCRAESSPPAAEGGLGLGAFLWLHLPDEKRIHAGEQVRIEAGLERKRRLKGAPPEQPGRSIRCTLILTVDDGCIRPQHIVLELGSGVHRAAATFVVVPPRAGKCGVQVDYFCQRHLICRLPIKFNVDTRS